MKHPDDRVFTDRVATVTGGSRGISREVARKLASQGYGVVINYSRSQAMCRFDLPTCDRVLARRSEQAAAPDGPSANANPWLLSQ